MAATATLGGGGMAGAGVRRMHDGSSGIGGGGGWKTGAAAAGTTRGGEEEEALPQLVAVLPPSPSTPLGAMPTVVAAMEGAAAAAEVARRGGVASLGDSGAAVYVMMDRELGSEVVELVGASTTLALPVSTPLPILVLHLKDVTRFLDVELSFLTLPAASPSRTTATAGRTGGATAAAAAPAPQLRHLLLTNRVSAIRVGVESATLPLALAAGWNHLALNLPDLAAAAFGETYHAATGVILHAATRVAHVYFQDRAFADCDLPPFLRTLRA
mgnify:CR=1 FL=1